VEQGITQIDMEAFQRMGLNAVLTRIHEVVGTAPCYVTFDIDVLDPAFACGTVRVQCCPAGCMCWLFVYVHMYGMSVHAMMYFIL
jgi:hypothetical protein